MGDEYVSTEHILLSLIKVSDEVKKFIREVSSDF